jgi:ubiquinone biosynthesis protein COQ4
METVLGLLSSAIGRPVDISALLEESPYLRNDKVREWLGYLMLRRIGPWEMKHGVELAGMHVRVMRELVKLDHVNALLAAERRINPRLDAWLSERHVASYTAEDLARYPAGTMGSLLYQRVAAMGYQVDLGAGLPLNTDFDLWIIRGLQLHDPEHLLVGGGFDLIGEIMPSVMRNACIARHFSPELASALTAPTLVLTLSELVSSVLYYPEALPTLMDRFQQAWRVGWNSGPYFFEKLEDQFDQPLAQARRALDINLVDELDTSALSDQVLNTAPAA